MSRNAFSEETATSFQTRCHAWLDCQISMIPICRAALQYIFLFIEIISCTFVSKFIVKAVSEVSKIQQQKYEQKRLSEETAMSFQTRCHAWLDCQNCLFTAPWLCALGRLCIIIDCTDLEGKTDNTSQLLRLWYLSQRRTANAEVRLRGQSLHCSHT